MKGVDSLRMACRVLDHHDLSYTLKRGKHFKIVVKIGAKSVTLITGGTLSDRRGVENFYHTLRRILVGSGVPFREDSKTLIHN